MKKLVMTLLVAALSPFLAMPALAQCVSADPAAIPEIRIDPLDATGPSQFVQPFTLRFRRVGVDTSPLTVTYQIVDEDSPLQERVGMNAGPQIEWRSNDTSRNIGALRQESFALLRSGKVSFAAGETTKEVGIRLFLTNLGEDLPAGTYREQYAVRYWCGDPSATAANELTGVLPVVVRIPNVLSANVAGGSKHGQIDFLDFASLSRSLSISVRSTGPYTVSARTLNGGALKREGATGNAAADRIAYTMQFGGQFLGDAGDASFTYPRAGLQGIQIPLDVRVEDVSKKRAGKYSDTLMLTLTPAG